MELNAVWLSMAISGAITIAIYSFLYRENSAFRIAEHILIGSFTGHTLVMAVKNIQEVGVSRVAGGDLIFIIPILLGVMMFIRYIPQYAWTVRYPLAVLVGVTAGIEARARFHGWIWTQVTETITLPLNNLTNIVIVVSLLAVMSYFTFTVKHTGAVGQWTRVGRLILLLTFGMTISMDLISRLGSVTARFDWLFSNVPYVTAIGALALGAFIVYEAIQGKSPERT